ncbi:hypothetical protein F4780DRAFT_270560 [Xylariomycetidae sp. FL0641]|nr:hypothetical protein F4780DRAFT_270560 [Xylariomycetidae sp. FL0641]
MAANADTPQFANSFGTAEPTQQRSNSRDYSGTDEWDASKTPPSRFQKRKGSILATPSSRDGHVERNRDAVEEFHKAHSKRWSISSKGSTVSSSGDAFAPAQEQMQQQQRRKSSLAGVPKEASSS